MYKSCNECNQVVNNAAAAAGVAKSTSMKCLFVLGCIRNEKMYKKN